LAKISVFLGRKSLILGARRTVHVLTETNSSAAAASKSVNVRRQISNAISALKKTASRKATAQIRRLVIGVFGSLICRL
jgi:hypothetical protein